MVTSDSSILLPTVRVTSVTALAANSTVSDTEMIIALERAALDGPERVVPDKV